MALLSNFIIKILFFEEHSIVVSITFSVIAIHYASMLRRFVVSDFHKCGILGSTIFMYDGGPLPIAKCVKQLFRQHFTYHQFIGQHFHVLWPTRSANLNSCHFWFLGRLKNPVYDDNIRKFSELNDAIHRHIHKISVDMLQATIESAIWSFNLVSENGVHYIKHVLP